MNKQKDVLDIEIMRQIELHKMELKWLKNSYNNREQSIRANLSTLKSQLECKHENMKIPESSMTDFHETCKDCGFVYII